MAGDVTEIRLADVVLFGTVIATALANYFTTRERVKVLETSVGPVVHWWNRIASNAADRLFVKSRASERDKIHVYTEAGNGGEGGNET